MQEGGGGGEKKEMEDEGEEILGLSFGRDVRSRQTLAFADIAGLISCLSVLRTLHLVPPGEKKRKR